MKTDLAPAEVPWLIQHEVDGVRHDAWLQRAVVVGDFQAELPLGNYVLYPDGSICDPMLLPVCVTCEAIPSCGELRLVDRQTSQEVSLQAFHLGMRPWPLPTDEKTCWWCNAHGELVVEAPPLCAQCEAHLRRK